MKSNPPPQHKPNQVQKQQIYRETAPPKQPRPPEKPIAPPQKPKPQKTKLNISPSNLINGFLPPSLYNRETKKILGILTAEDLLLIALILLFSENEENNDPFVIIALIYILLSDYIELPEF